jgi:DNA-binding LacI/PurR family transcriptional regulator
LCSLGHESIACMIPVDPAPSVNERLLGFRIGLERRKRKFSAARNVLRAEHLSFEAAFEAARALFGETRAPSAIFCGNDEMAAGVLCAARKAGRTVPEELSVIGFDNITMSKYTDPPLTTIGVDKEDLGRRAMTRLLELVEGADEMVKTEHVPVELIVRGSTAQRTAT